MQRLAAVLAAIMLTAAGCGDGIRVGIIGNGPAAAEADGLKKAVGNAASTRVISPRAAEGCDVVWLHSTDTLLGGGERNAWKDGLRDYVTGGGRLVLSMEAVRLLNIWGIEPVPVEHWNYECIDEGFGRKIGFHSRLGHPLFASLHGGAYPWHGAEDNVCRINGFSKGNFPEADGAKVIACQWEYVFMRPEYRVIWETPVGKGSILAIGGCLYYDLPNFDRAILDAFTGDCVKYMAGLSDPTAETNFWEKDTPEVVRMHKGHDELCRICAADYEPVHPSRPEKIDFPDSGMGIKKTASYEYTDVLSPHSMAILPERGGIEEIWSQPIMSARDFRVWIEYDGSGTPVCLSSLVPEIEIHPHAVLRRYDLGGLKIREIISSSPRSALTLAHYEWEGEGLHRIYADYKSNLRMMWPYDENVLGSLYYGWSSELNATVVRDDGKRFVSVVGSNVPGHPVVSGQFGDFSYDGGYVRGIPTDLLQVGAVTAYDLDGLDALDIIFAASSTGEESLLAAYEDALERPADIVEESYARYRDWYASVVNVETPDTAFNEAFRWAELSAGQFIAETPGLGTALFGGYSSSRRGWGGGHRVSGRPGYAWYFGRDSEWAALAFADMGDFGTVRSCIELLLKYQAPDGKIYHELTTGGVVHYDASDSTPLLVHLAAHYLRLSGDISFIREHYEGIRKAMAYCASTDRDGDGLIENSNVGHGWLEGGGNLWGFRTEFYLAGLWKAALGDAAYIAEALGHRAEARRFSDKAEAVSGALEAFWNDETGWYNYAKNADGSYQDEFLVLTAVPVYLGVLDSERSAKMAAHYVGPLLSTDWGSRTIFETSGATGGGAYHPRNVWPLFTGWKSLAEYSGGYFDQGFASLYGSLMTYKSFSYGHIAEVINADEYRNNGITQHQCWSETMTIMPFMEGTLGFRADACSRSFSLSPRLPLDWDSFKAAGMRVGEQRIGLDMERDASKTVYRISGGKGLRLRFSPAFAPGAEILNVKVNGKETGFSLKREGAYTVPSIDIRLGDECTVEIGCRPGAGALPVYVPARKLQPSSGFRLIGQSFSSRRLDVIVSGRPGASHCLSLYVPAGYTDVSGAEVESFDGKILRLKVDFPEDGAKPYCLGNISVGVAAK